MFTVVKRNPHGSLWTSKSILFRNLALPCISYRPFMYKLWHTFFIWHRCVYSVTKIMLDKIELVTLWDVLFLHIMFCYCKLSWYIVDDGYKDPSNNYRSDKTYMEIYVYTTQRLKIIVIGGRTRSPDSAIASNTVQFVDTALNIFSSRVKLKPKRHVYLETDRYPNFVDLSFREYVLIKCIIYWVLTY